MYLLHPPSSLTSRLFAPISNNPTNKLHHSHLTSIIRSSINGGSGIDTHLHLHFSSSSQSDPLASLSFSSSVGSPSSIGELSQWNLGQRQINILSVAACTVAISTSWLFFSAIPTLLSFKRAAESLEKLLDVTAEELPDTMAAVRLSGMEISDLTMELSDIGQEITQGVRSSTRAVRLAEDRLRRLTTMAPNVPVQGQAPLRDETDGPALARTARNIREGIVKGRAVLGAIFGITQFSRWALNFLVTRQEKRSL